MRRTHLLASYSDSSGSRIRCVLVRQYRCSTDTGTYPVRAETRSKSERTHGCYLRSVCIVGPWQSLVLVAFSDAGWATRLSKHSQSAAFIVLAHPRGVEGHSSTTNVLDYSASKITLTVKSSYDAELHACTGTANIAEYLQASFAELSHWNGAGNWSVTGWLSMGPKTCWPLCIVIDAKGFWTHIQREYKTEKRSAIYIREMMELLVRCCAKAFWVNSGHMVCDLLTKLSVNDPGLDLLYYVLELAEVRITYCDHSWKKEMSMKKATVLKPLDLLDPTEWNEDGQNSYDVPGAILRSRVS